MRSAWSGWRWLGLLALVAAIAWLAQRGLPDGKLHVYFLDVGQGDAILVQAPDGRQLLVDGGPSPTALLNQLGDVLPFWDRAIDLVVLTHPDIDHMAGLSPLLGRYRVAQVLDTVATDAEPRAAPWLSAVAEQGIERTYAQRGMRVLLGDVELTVLHPGAETSESTMSDNNRSIVLRLDYGRTAFLLTGDAEAPVEEALLAQGAPLQADVLKVGHHGSARSTSPRFLDAVRPQVAVIQVGADNDFGHPAPSVLDRLTGVQLARTDRNGRIEVISDGSRIRLRKER